MSVISDVRDKTIFTVLADNPVKCRSLTEYGIFSLDIPEENHYRSLMAQMKDEDEEKDDVPVVKKRRRPKKKAVEDDEDGAGVPNGKKESVNEDDEEDDESSISTGNVVLDIVLDFRDDCIDWAKEHFAIAVVIISITALIFLSLSGFTIYCIVKYINRPTLQSTFSVYHLGSYIQAKKMALEVLKYAQANDITTRSNALFILGASTCFMAETTWDADRQPYYLAAAKYLRDAEEYGFTTETHTEGYFLLGKSLYMSGEMIRCREPLLRALELDSPEKKTIHWFLAYSYFFDPKPDFQKVLRQVQIFQSDPTTTEDEFDEGEIFRALILVQLSDADGAEKTLNEVPQRDRFRTIRHFVNGQIAFLRARELREKYLELENNRNPLSLSDIPIAPAPVQPIKPRTPSTPADSLPIGIPNIPLDSMPVETPQDIPQKNPNLKNLLPKNNTTKSSKPSKYPESSILAVASVSPMEPNDPWLTAIVPVPTDEDLNSVQDSTLAKRLSSIRSRITGPYTQDAAPNPEMINAENSDDSEKVIELPPSGKEENAPIPAEFPDGSFTKLPKADPIQENIQKFHDAAIEKYKEAIKHFQEVRRQELFVLRWLRLSELLEGICYNEMGEFSKSQSVYLKITETYPGTSEAAAANFFWAEIELKFGRGESALRGFGRAFETMRNEPNYACFWLTKETILERCRDMIRNHIRMKEYKEALTLLSFLRGVMLTHEAAQFRGEAYESWAVSLRQQADATLGPAGEKLLQNSYIKYQRSGEAFASLRDVDFSSTDFIDWIWRSAENYRLGKDFRHAISQYKNFLRMTVSDHRPEVYLYLGEMYVHLDALDTAVEVMEDAIQSYPNNALIPQFRMTLSRAYIEKKEWEKAKEVLQQNLVSDFSPSSSIYRDSMFALGKLFFEWGNLLEAIPYLEDAIKNYPDAIQTADSHYYLSQAYMRQAANLTKSAKESILEGVRQQLLMSADTERGKALLHIQKTDELLSRRQEVMELSESEQLMLRNALFGAGSILMDLKQYGQAISSLSLVATHYQDRPEVLNALIQLETAYRRMGKLEDAETALNQAEFVLKRLQKIGSIPSENNWEAIIRVQRNYVKTGNTIE